MTHGSRFLKIDNRGEQKRNFVGKHILRLRLVRSIGKISKIYLFLKYYHFCVIFDFNSDLINRHSLKKIFF